MAQADDLDVIVAPSTTPTEREQAYDRLTKMSFDSVAAKLLTLMGHYQPQIGINPVDPDHPWLEPRVSEHDRIGLTLKRLWSFYFHNQKPRGEHFGLLLDLLENQSIGNARFNVAQVIENNLYWGVPDHDASLPPLSEVLPRLEKIAKNQKESGDLRQRVLGILLEPGDPNRYLDEAIAPCEAESDPLRRSEMFRSILLRHVRSEKLTPENRAKCLRYGFQLLEKIDDGRSGHGYFLAIDLGHLAGVESTIRGDQPFRPDLHLPQYNKGRNGLTDAYFQETVDNARKWWSEHRSSP